MYKIMLFHPYLLVLPPNKYGGFVMGEASSILAKRDETRQ